jgi:hypothetical protein
VTTENSKCSAAMLTALFAAIKHGYRLRTNTESFTRAMELGWFGDYQIKDRVYDLRLEGFTDELLAQAGTTMAMYHHRPRRIDRSAGAFRACAPRTWQSFSSISSGLGSTSTRCQSLTGWLPGLSRSELSVLWFSRTHHKMVPITFTTPEFTDRQEPILTRREEFKTKTGYKIDACFVGDEVHFLEVRAPRYRCRAEPEPTTCEVCGVEWLKGDPADSAMHRREHKKRLAGLQPSPDPRFLEALANDAEPELMTIASPKWGHHEIYLRAATFRREFHYDFVQWAGPHMVDDDPTGQGFLFNDDTGVFGHGAIVGACAFRWREYRNHPPLWAMQWIWIAPKARRHGILSRRWDGFRTRFGKFAIEPSLSDAMEAFAAKHGVVDLVAQ